MALPIATIRTQVTAPLWFVGGYDTVARVFGFGGLLDGQDHLALGLGDRAAAVMPAGRGAAPLVRLHSEGHTGTCSAANAATAGRSRAKPSSGSPRLLAFWARRDVASACTPSSRPTRYRTRSLDTHEEILALGHREDERSCLVAAQMLQALGASRVALLTNNPDKARQLRRYGVTMTARVPTAVHLSETRARHLATKARHRAHALDIPTSAG